MNRNFDSELNKKDYNACRNIGYISLSLNIFKALFFGFSISYSLFFLFAGFSNVDLTDYKVFTYHSFRVALAVTVPFGTLLYFLCNRNNYDLITVRYRFNYLVNNRANSFTCDDYVHRFVNDFCINIPIPKERFKSIGDGHKVFIMYFSFILSLFDIANFVGIFFSYLDSISLLGKVLIILFVCLIAGCLLWWGTWLQKVAHDNWKSLISENLILVRNGNVYLNAPWRKLKKDRIILLSNQDLIGYEKQNEMFENKRYAIPLIYYAHVTRVYWIKFREDLIKIIYKSDIELRNLKLEYLNLKYKNPKWISFCSKRKKKENAKIKREKSLKKIEIKDFKTKVKHSENYS